mgnify:CR=1 FL=1
MGTKLHNLTNEMKKNKASYILIAPYVTLFFIFTVLPVTVSMILSLTYFNGLEFPRFIGWQNYTRLFLNDDVFLIAVKNTFVFAAITGPISYLACFFFAWLINELSSKVRSVLTLLFYAPAISGNAYLIWQMLFSGDSYGLVNSTLMQIGVLQEPVIWLKDPKYMLGIIMIVQLWLSLGTSFLAFIGGLQTVDSSLYEAGAVDGVKNRWQELWYITLPVMRPFLMFGAVMQITASFAVSDVAAALAGNPSTDYAAHTIVTHLQDYGGIRFEMGYASTIATLLFFIMVSANKIVQKLLKKVGE